MSQITAIFMLLVIYLVLPIMLLVVVFFVYKKLTMPKKMAYTAMPKLNKLTETSLPPNIHELLEQVNEKGETLKVLLGDTNADGKIDNNDAKNETFVIVKKLLDEHIVQAVDDYMNLSKLGENRTEKQVIQSSNLTGLQALTEILKTVNQQFDELLDAAYQSNAQKLLVTNRYLKSRFSHLD